MKIQPAQYPEDAAWALQMRRCLGIDRRRLAKDLFIPTSTWEAYEMGIRPVPDYLRRDATDLLDRKPFWP